MDCSAFRRFAEACDGEALRMRVLVDVGHPAQVLMFRHVIALLGREGHEVLVTSRAKDVTTQLLKALRIEHVCLGRRRTGTLGMGGEYVARMVRMLKLAKRFKPDVMLAQTGVTISPVGAMLGVPRIVLEEAEHARVQRALGLPLATKILTCRGYEGEHGRREVKLDGFWVETWLDRRYFRPDAEVLRRSGVDPDEPFIVLRTVSRSAMHDVREKGAGPEDIRRAIDELSAFGRVLVSSEEPLPNGLKAHANPVPVDHIQDLLARARLYIGDGGTMAAEAALLGRPTVYCNPLRCGYLRELAERYELIRMTDSLAEGVEIARGLLERTDLEEEWQRRRAKVPECEDMPRRMYAVLKETVEQRGGGVRRRAKEDPSARVEVRQTSEGAGEDRCDYAWSSITLSTRNVGNHLIEWSLRRALKLGKPRLTFDSFEQLDGPTIERIHRECRMVVSPGCTVFEPGQNAAYEQFGLIEVPKPCFGGCFWPAWKGRGLRALAGRTRVGEQQDVTLVRKLSEPVGARDPYTFDVLRREGIDARLVGCPTLMTEHTATEWRRTDGRNVVVSLGRGALVGQCRLIGKLSKHWDVTVLVHESYERALLGMIRGVRVVTFESPEPFIERYAHADLVVTGRLHGALPAVAHGTPVLFYGDSTDTRFTLLEHLGITVYSLSPELAEAAENRALTAPAGETFERLAELRRSFVAYAGEYGIGTRVSV